MRQDEDDPSCAVLFLHWQDHMTLCARHELVGARKAAAERWGVPESAITVTPAGGPQRG